LSKFRNTNWFLSYLNKLLKKIDYTKNEAAVLENLYILVTYFKL